MSTFRREIARHAECHFLQFCTIVLQAIHASLYL